MLNNVILHFMLSIAVMVGLFIILACLVGTLMTGKLELYQKNPAVVASAMASVLIVFVAHTTFMERTNSNLVLEKIATGVFIAQNKNIYYENIPEYIPTVYEYKGNSGVTVRKLNYVRRISIADPYDTRIAEVVIVITSYEEVMVIKRNIQKLEMSEETIAVDEHFRGTPGVISSKFYYLIYPYQPPGEKKINPKLTKYTYGA